MKGWNAVFKTEDPDATARRDRGRGRAVAAGSRHAAFASLPHGGRNPDAEVRREAGKSFSDAGAGVAHESQSITERGAKSKRNRHFAAKASEASIAATISAKALPAGVSSAVAANWN